MKLDMAAYQAALDVARLDLAVFNWDPLRHPRDLNGRWRHVGGKNTKLTKLGPVFGQHRDIPTDTQDLHTQRNAKGGWEYTPERRALHQAIIEAFLEGKPVQPEGQRRAVFTAGGSGAGKSTVVDKMKLEPDGAVKVDPDLIKAQMPEYRKLVEEGDERAAAIAHEESSDISKELLATALKRGHHVVVDGTGASNGFLARMDAAIKAGHEVEVHYVNISVDEALKRAAIRAKDTGRAVPEGTIRDIHRNVSRLFKRVLDRRGKLATLVVWDNTTDPRQIGHLDGGSFAVDDKAAMKAFMEKGNVKRAA